jgi:hypothetical protein
MDIRLLGGIILISAFLLYMVFVIKKSKQLPSFILGWVLIILLYIVTEVKNGFFFAIIPLLIGGIILRVYYRRMIKAQKDKDKVQ